MLIIHEIMKYQHHIQKDERNPRGFPSRVASKAIAPQIKLTTKITRTVKSVVIFESLQCKSLAIRVVVKPVIVSPTVKRLISTQFQTFS